MMCDLESELACPHLSMPRDVANQNFSTTTIVVRKNSLSGDNAVDQGLETHILCDACYLKGLQQFTSSVLHRFLFATINRQWEEQKEKKIIRSMMRSKYSETPCCIVDSALYLGSQYSACNAAALQSLGITAVLVCGKTLPRFFLRRLNSDTPVSSSEIKYRRIPINDCVEQPLLPYLDSAVNFLEQCIHQEGRRVLVHCAMGISRSASVVIAYVMKQQQWDYDTAHEYVQRRRPIVCPNPRFKYDLRTRWQARWIQVSEAVSTEEVTLRDTTTEPSDISMSSVSDAEEQMPTSLASSQQ